LNCYTHKYNHHLRYSVYCHYFLFLHTFFFFFFNDTAPTEIYTLSLHDALPIFTTSSPPARRTSTTTWPSCGSSSSSLCSGKSCSDRKSTRLNSSHVAISYAVFCLKKKKINNSNDMKRIK